MTSDAATDTYRVNNVSRGAELASESRKASSPVRRAIGLMGRRGLGPGQGLIIQPCNGVVSFFMRFPIDVLFVAQDGTICHLVPNLVPWRVSKIVRASKYVIELPAGTIAASGTDIGDVIEISPA